MTDIVAQMQELEADLVRKLDAVRLFLTTFVEVRDDMASALKAPPRPAVRREDVKRKTPAEKIDKFGSYGQAVIDASLAILPGENESPMATRVLVEKLDFRGVEVRGENKVNALSALLARSSKIKGHGRSGWTIYGERQHNDFDELLGADAPQKELEPTSEVAVGSSAAGWGVPPPAPASSNPPSSWPS